MFKEFNVKFEDAEIIGGADNLLEGTGVTKVILRGDNKLSSLDSTFKDCSQLDTVDGELDLNGISDIDSLLENSNLVTSIDLKNVNNKNITANNAFSHVNQINIGGETYNKEAIQNIISSREWTFNNINYIDTVGEDVVTHTPNISEEDENTQIVINDALEQKARNVEIKGQTYQNLIQGKEGAELLADIKFESIEGNPSELEPTIDHPVCVEVIEGQTYQNLIEGKGEYNLTDTYNATWTESNSSFEGMSNMIEIPEIFGNTFQGYANVVSAQQIVNAINGSITNGESWLHSNDSTTFTVEYATPSVAPTSSDNFIQLKANTTYTVRFYRFGSTQNPPIYYYLGNNYSVRMNANGGSTFTTDSSGKVLFYPASVQGGQLYLRVVEGSVDLNKYDYNEFDLNYIQSVGDLYVDEEGNPILDDEGNEQYKLEIESNNKNLLTSKMCDFIYNPDNWISTYLSVKMKPNTKYTFSANSVNVPVGSYLRFGILGGEGSFAYTNYLVNNDNRNGSETINVNVPTITVQSDSKGYIRFYNYFTTGGLPVLKDAFVSPQLEENDVATSYESPQSNKTTILMPQPLRVAGYERYGYNNSGNDLNKPIRDILYYDTSKKKFFIKKYVMTNCITGNKFIENTIYKQYYTRNIVPPVTINQSIGYVYAIRPFEQSIRKSKLSLIHHGGTTSQSTMLCALKEDYTLEECNALFGNVPLYYGYYKNDTELYYEVIETKILEKPSLETYSPKTCISINTEIQPSQMNITNKRNVFLPLGLQANKDYTLQLDSVGKDDKPITVNLGGSEITTQPVNDTSTHHKVVIKTPSTLTTDKLELSGEGVVVNDVMLFEGGEDVIKQEVEYIEGIQSIGELQEDGTYKIDIRTNNNYEKLWREL